MWGKCRSREAPVREMMDGAARRESVGEKVIQACGEGVICEGGRDEGQGGGGGGRRHSLVSLSVRMRMRRALLVRINPFPRCR